MCSEQGLGTSADFPAVLFCVNGFESTKVALKEEPGCGAYDCVVSLHSPTASAGRQTGACLPAKV